MNNKQIPFRYPEELEEDFKELFKWQSYTTKKNEAIISAVKICAELSRVLKTFDNGKYYSNGKTKIYQLTEILKKISKSPGEKDIKNLDLKK